MSDLSIYQTLLLNELRKLRETCIIWEKELHPDLPEHASGLIRCAIGKAQLLMNGKLKQFSGLVEASVNGSDENAVTASDLQGFWDLVYLEISDVDGSFSRLLELKKNSWTEAEPPKHTVPVQRQPLKAKNVKTSDKTSEDRRLAAKKRLEEAKKKMMECKLSKNMEEEAIRFDAPAFFSIRSPPKGRKESMALLNKTSASTPKASTTDLAPCMRITRSMKKSS